MTIRLPGVILSLLISLPLLAQQNPTGEVVIERRPDISKSYRERRGTHGLLFSIIGEQFYPKDYRSLFQDAYIEDIVGESRIALIGAELGYKYNFSVGSLGFLINYAQGSIDGAVSNVARTLTVTRTGAAVNYAADVLFEEPWVVPYAQAGAHQFSVSESDALGEDSATTGMAFNYKFGLMFQLDWIEDYFDENARENRAYSASALENTFLEVYYSEHLASSNAIDPSSTSNDGDPNLASSGEIGVGLKMEF